MLRRVAFVVCVQHDGAYGDPYRRTLGILETCRIFKKYIRFSLAQYYPFRLAVHQLLSKTDSLNIARNLFPFLAPSRRHLAIT